MLNNILFKALLKISKENSENNYIYSDVYFPKTFIKQKTKKEKERQSLFKNLYHLDKKPYPKNSKTKKIKDSKDLLINNNKKQRNREDKFSLFKKLTLFTKTDLKTLSSLPRVNSQKNNSHLNLDEQRNKFNVKNINSTQFDSLHLTPKKQKSFQFDENISKKLNALKNNNNNNTNNNTNLDSNTAINFHILNINAPRVIKLKKKI